MQVLHAAVDTILCLIKEGSIIPFGPELQYTGEIIWINKTKPKVLDFESKADATISYGGEAITINYKS